MSKIKPKRSYTTGAVPTTSDLEANELAINWVDGKAYTKTAAGNIVSVTLGGGGGGSLSATVTIPGLGDPYYDSVSLLLHGDGNLTDKSGTPKTVTAVGSAATSTTQKKFGTASLASLAAGDFYTVPDSSAFDFGSGDFTVEMWLYPVAGNSGYRSLYGKRATTGPVAPVQAFIDPSGVLSVFAANAASAATVNWTVLITASSSPSVGQWSHLAMVRSGSTVTVYLNGASVGSSSALGGSALVQNDAAFCVGSTYSGGAGDAYFGGYIDEFRVSKGVARYTASFTPATAAFADASGLTVPVVGTGSVGSGLSWSSVPASATASGTAGQIAYDGDYQYTCVATNTWRRVALPSWDTEFASVSLLLPMDASTGFTDASLNAFSVTANGDARISTAQSKFGGASALFDGTGDFLSIPNNSAFDFGSGDFAIEAWVYITANSTADSDGNRGTAVCSTWNAGVPPISGWILAVMGNSTTTGTGLQLDSWNGANSGTLFRATASIAHSTWHHIAASVIGGTRRLYLNGTLLTDAQTITVGSGYTPVNSLGNALRIAGSALTGYPLSFNGYIDDLRITKGSGRSYSAATIPVPTAASGRS